MNTGQIIDTRDDLSTVRNLVWLLDMTTVNTSPSDNPDGAAIAELCQCLFSALDRADARLEAVISEATS